MIFQELVGVIMVVQVVKGPLALFFEFNRSRGPERNIGVRYVPLGEKLRGNHMGPFIRAITVSWTKQTATARII